MASPIHRAVDTYRNDGLAALSATAFRSLRRRAATAYWRARKSRTFEIDGVEATFDTRGRAARSLRIFDRGERIMVRDLLSELEASDVFWDVGAHIGFHSSLAGQRARRVEAFEPTPHTVRQGRANLERNEVDGQVHECAVWDADETLTLDPDSSATGGGAISVPARTGDGLVDEGLPQPTVAKIDVEGAEPRVVDGMAETLADDRCRIVYCEVHRPADTRPSVEDHGSSVDGFLESFRDLGFAVETLADRGPDFHVKATALE
ncbi:FkbM family methyltransferase [Halostagnicola kamekurae]|uniref:Methyltransferase, FkbM family n=1 Tax=Halostagnicola kamekurae TaxID=619731 RepID=A0A1I6Q331_9EURY|nr:FkbM family methyltransferase [Halostagnicola kamekurae]SFS46876.1 methyltransferase, FkbM family [Halostagnicola kamekurae]